MSSGPMGINVEAKRLLLTKRECDPETGLPYPDREPLEVLEWTREDGLKTLFRREANALDDRR